VAGPIAETGALLKELVTWTEQITTPPPPLPTPLHCWMSVIGSAEVVVVVLQVAVPLRIGVAASVHFVTVIADGAVAAPLLSTWFTMVTVHRMPCPPTLLASSVSALHWVTGAAAAPAGWEPWLNRTIASTTATSTNTIPNRDVCLKDAMRLPEEMAVLTSAFDVSIGTSDARGVRLYPG
jgi:hypothetical protein